ncbi:MAG: cupredoxin domain-containing protein [Nanoarchaeota archaeon]
MVAIANIACTAQTSDTPPPLPDDSTMADTPADQAGSPSGVKEFTMTAFQFGFDPATITVKKGNTVRIKVTSTDVVHSLVIPEYGIDERLPPSEEKVVEFVADTTGEFPFRCGVYCGEDHNEMIGRIVVEE